MPRRRHTPTPTGSAPAVRPAVNTRYTLSDAEPPPSPLERRREVERICGFPPGLIDAELERQRLAREAAAKRAEVAQRASVARQREYMEWSLARYVNGNR